MTANVLVGLVVSDDLAQQRAAMKRLGTIRDANGRAFVSDVVLAELSWVLESAYGYERSDVARAVEGIVKTPPLVVEEPTIVEEALAAFRSSPAGFSDHLVLAAARRRGALPLLTFDRKLLKQAGCERP